jgi:hypothetical protein
MGSDQVARVEDAVEKHRELVLHKEGIESQIRKKKAQLGVTEKQNLQHLMSNKYLQVQMQV